MNGDEVARDLRSYGRRRGRKPSDKQAALLRDLLPTVSIDLTSPPPLWGRPASVSSPLSGEASGVGGRSRRNPAELLQGSSPHPLPLPFEGKGEERAGTSEVFLEIGFGGGEHLVWQANHNPLVTCIGCEPYEEGVVKVLSAIEAQGLTNIRLHMGDARDVLRWLPEASIARAFILFPDPWPKKKHRKRRLVNAETLKLLARVMTPGAELRIGTDIGDYARTMLEAFAREPRFHWQAQRPSDWRIRPDDWPETRYEAKAAREGRVRYYFRWVRVTCTGVFGPGIT